MLIDFTVENFRSIKEPQTLSLLATTSSEKPENYFSLKNEPKIKLLKSAVIYGPNASGKSNIIRALQTCLSLIRDSTDLKLDQSIDSYDPFKLCKSCQGKPTRFELEFVIDKIRYRYSFSYTQTEIVQEELFFYPNKVKNKLFIRKQGKPIDFGTSLVGPKKSIEEQLLKNNLFFSKAANSNNMMLQTIYREINTTFLVDPKVCLSEDKLYQKFWTYLIDVLGPSGDVVKRFINKIDNSIKDVKIIRNDDKETKINLPEKMDDKLKEIIRKTLSYEIQTIHKMSGENNEYVDFDFKEESAGTLRAFNISGHIFASIYSGSTLIIDELNNSLHPVITRFIIEIFNSKKSNRNNGQIIFTTHDATLLDPKLFRRDQIWFTEKTENYETNLYSLSEFDYKEVRANTPFEKWYLSGKFGAIPIINDLDIFNDEASDAEN